MGSTSNSGHYQAYISNVENQQQNWINFDDDYVTQVTVKNTTELFNNFKYLIHYIVPTTHPTSSSTSKSKRQNDLLLSY